MYLDFDQSRLKRLEIFWGPHLISEVFKVTPVKIQADSWKIIFLSSKGPFLD